jgi:hypothetical protein
MNRIGDKGKSAVLNLSLAEMAFLLVFALAIVASPIQAQLERLRTELDLAKRENEKLREEQSLRSNIPEPCEGYWLDIIAIGPNRYCIEGAIMTFDEMVSRYAARQRDLEESGDCKVRIRFYSEPSMSADEVFTAQRALRAQFYYREESGIRRCPTQEY